MTKGLAFLSKKRFHPGRRDNMEKVWLAEQKEKNEKEVFFVLCIVLCSFLLLLFAYLCILDD